MYVRTIIFNKIIRNMKEYKREYNKNWYAKNKERKMEYQRQYRAKKREEANKNNTENK